MMEAVHKRLIVVGGGCIALACVGSAMHRIGALPPALVPWAKPVLILGAVAVASSEALELAPRLLGRRRMRWTGLALTLLLPAVVVAGAMEHVGGVSDALAAGLPAAIAGVAAALLADAWVGMTRGLLPRSGVAAAVLAGCGLLLLTGAGMAGRWTPWVAVAGLGAILVGSISALYARAEVKRMNAAAANLPNSRMQVEEDLDLLLRQRQRSRS